MIVLGLTGSIGMGKSTTAGLFRRFGVPVFDADACVHELYAGVAAEAVERAFPGSTSEGRVDRPRLAALVLGRPEALTRLEGIIHPLVAARRAAFLSQAGADGERIVVLDIPLLLEGKSGDAIDAIVVVSANGDVQRDRVLARPGMDVDKFTAILSRQMPDADKRKRAHFVVMSDRGFAFAEKQVRTILTALFACNR